MELGEYIDSNAPYGYRLINKTLSVYEPEAIIVRWIYQSYLNGWSISEIAKDLSVRDVPTKCGKSTWTSTRVSYILSNERYIGDCKYQKTCREAVVPFRQSKNRGQEDMFYAKETHAPLLDKQLFYQVQELLEKKKKQHCTEIPPRQYPLTSRIRCSECGSFYHRKVRSGVKPVLKHSTGSLSASAQHLPCVDSMLMDRRSHFRQLIESTGVRNQIYTVEGPIIHLVYGISPFVDWQIAIV